MIKQVARLKANSLSNKQAAPKSSDMSVSDSSSASSVRPLPPMRIMTEEDAPQPALSPEKIK